MDAKIKKNCRELSDVVYEFERSGVITNDADWRLRNKISTLRRELLKADKIYDKWITKTKEVE